MMFELFAQANNPNAGNPFAPGPGGGINPQLQSLFVGIVVGTCVYLLVMLAVVILFFLTLSRALTKCRPYNRAMQPGMVWLNFVPCLNIVWSFVTVVQVAQSLKNEFRDRGMRNAAENYGKTLGLTALILNIVIGVVSRVILTVGQAQNDPNIVIGSLVFSIVGQLVIVVLFIMYWVKIAGFSKQLSKGSSIRRERERDRDDDYDDRRDEDYDDRRDEPDEKPWRR